MKKLLYGISFFIFISPPIFAQAKLPAVDLILPKENKELNYISQKISENNFFSVTTYIKNIPNEKQQGDILIVVSDELLPLLKESKHKAKFALYVNSTTFKHSNTIESSALFSDQPIQRQLLLLSKIFNKKTIVGIPYNDEKHKIKLNEVENKFVNLELLFSHTEKNDIRSVNKTIQNSDVLLATPEASIYNSQTIKSILLSSYRHQTPVIGPNEGFVIAGALASVVTNSDQYIEEIIDMVKEYLNTKSLPESRHPKKFTVKTNINVASSLGLDIPSGDQLTNELKED